MNWTNGHIIELVSGDSVGVGSEFGDRRPLRPSPRAHTLDRCLRGHDLRVAGFTTGWSPGLRLPRQTCEVCWALQDERASWCLVDPAEQHQADTAPAYGLALVRIPPAVPRGGVGQLQLRVDGQVRGDVDVAVCGPCRRAVLEQVRVDPGSRRRGYGRVLVAAALALAPSCTWSTTAVDQADPVACAFWATIDWPGQLGTPAYCSDMQRAAGLGPD
jgi:GNAT superfamily N-acetyltransferase